MKDILPILTAFAREEEGIRALILFGSRVRPDRPADEFSDYDLLLLADDPARYLEQDGWLKGLFDVVISFWEPTLAGGTELRFVTREGQDADLLFFEAIKAPEIARDAEFRAMLARGYRPIIDRICFADMLGAIEAQAYRPMTEAEFLNLSRNFAFHIVWAAKKAMRGEIWVAKRSADAYLKDLFLAMLEFHAKATHGAEYDVWHAGRFLDRWADAETVQMLPQIFAAYDAKDILRALAATAGLFRKIARETAEAAGYPAPDDELDYAINYVNARR